METQDHIIGKRTYELTNHLGNVLSVISDKPIPYDDGSNNTNDWFLADIRQSTDYSPFGVTLDGHNLTLTGAEKSRMGFQGQEHDDGIKRGREQCELYLQDARSKIGQVMRTPFS